MTEGRKQKAEGGKRRAARGIEDCKQRRLYLPLSPSAYCFLPSAFGLLPSAQRVLDPAGPQAARIGGHWWLMLYTLTTVYVLTMVVLVVAAWRRRGTVREVAAVAPETKLDEGGERRMSWVVTAGTAATVVILFVLLVSSFVTGRALYSIAAPPNEALVVKVTGYQWWWRVEYEDPIPSRQVSTANEIHLPIGRPVLFKLQSNDVIHSFWVPNLHGKTDLIPGHETTVWLRADRAGTFRGQCAEFCGHQHAHMAFTVVAEPPEQFAAWYEAQLRPAPQPSTQAQARGQQVFMSSPCVLCHRVAGTDAGGRVGPDLTHVGARPTIAAGTLDNTREHLARWVTDSQSIKPGNRMPPNPLAPEDLAALLDYLQSLK